MFRNGNVKIGRCVWCEREGVNVVLSSKEWVLAAY